MSAGSIGRACGMGSEGHPSAKTLGGQHAEESSMHPAPVSSLASVPRLRLDGGCPAVPTPTVVNIPRKLLRILAAFSHSPGSVKPCMKLDDPVWAREPPS